jgi:hypothetical protein
MSTNDRRWFKLVVNRRVEHQDVSRFLEVQGVLRILTFSSQADFSDVSGPIGEVVGGDGGRAHGSLLGGGGAFDSAGCRTHNSGKAAGSGEDLDLRASGQAEVTRMRSASVGLDNLDIGAGGVEGTRLTNGLRHGLRAVTKEVGKSGQITKFKRKVRIILGLEQSGNRMIVQRRLGGDKPGSVFKHVTSLITAGKVAGHRVVEGLAEHKQVVLVLQVAQDRSELEKLTGCSKNKLHVNEKAPLNWVLPRS